MRYSPGSALRRSHDGGFHGRRWASIIVVCVLAAGIAVYAGTRPGAAPSPKVTGLSTAWTAHSPGVQCEDFDSDNTWVADGNVASCLGDGITSYQLSTGRAQWTWQPEPRANQDPTIGSLSNAVDQGIGVVAYSYATIPKSSTDNPVTTTTEISGIDLATGHVVWTDSIPVSEDLEPPGVVVGDGVAAMVFDSEPEDSAGTRGQLVSQSLSVLDVSTGAAAWRVAVPVGTAVPGDCHPISVAIAGSWLYEAARCPQAQGTDRLYGLSPQTGAVVATAALDDTACVSGPDLGLTALWAVPGYVLGGCNDLSGQEAMLIIPAGTVKQRVLGYTSPADPLNYFHGELWNPDFAVYGSTLYAITIASPPGAVSVTAFNLAKGTVAWSRRDTPTISGYTYAYQVNVVGADSRGVTVLETGTATQQDAAADSLLLLSADSGTATFGPGIKYDYTADSGNNEFAYSLTGPYLIAFPSGNYSTAPITAYRTGGPGAL